jgi:hypothetical protein
MRALFVVLLLGCGSKSALDQVPLTSVESDKKLDKLAPADMKQLCQDMQAFKTKNKASDEDNLKLGCNAQALIMAARSKATDDAAIRAECTKTLQECRAKNNKIPDAKDIDCNDTKFSAEMGSCDATVGELVDCLTDMNKQLKQFAAEDVCSQLKANDKVLVGKLLEKLSKTPRCDAMQAKCKPPTPPKVGGGSGSGMPSPQILLAKLDDFRSRMCACKDAACATEIHREFTTWGTSMPNPGDQKYDAATQKTLTDAAQAYLTCTTKLLGDRVMTPK